MYTTSQKYLANPQKFLFLIYGVFISPEKPSLFLRFVKE